MLNQLTISEAASRLRKKEFSAKELMQACIERVNKVDGQVKAFLSFDVENALKQAEAADQKLRDNSQGTNALTGIPIGMKDVLCVKDQPCNCSSKILGNFRAPYNATVVEKLKAAGAITFGRL